MSIAVGDLTNLEYSDSFSLESSNINEEMVASLHKTNKKIYAWTVNTEESINQLIDLGVDNIITDNITLDKKTIESSKYSNVLLEIIKKFD